MTPPDRGLRGLAHRWERFWFKDIPPHSFAFLRITLGLLNLVSLAGLTPVSMFWSLDGLAPVSSDGTGPRAFLVSHGLGPAAGWVFFAFLVTTTTAMTIGYRTGLAVLGTFVGLVLQSYWNHLPLSSAHLVLLALVFCSIWADAGRVWSIDAARRPSPPVKVQAWPLWLMRFHVAVVYLSGGLWKLSSSEWRDGTAVHWALSLNGFHRFPWPIPIEVEPLLVLMTWATLLFELLFALGVLFRRTRTATLLVGVALHVGLFLTLELGPFSLVMIASYIVFIDPERTPHLFGNLARRRVHIDAPVRA